MENIVKPSLLSRLGRSSLILTLLLSFNINTAYGAVIGTRQALEAQQGADAAARVGVFLARDDARAALVRMGVDPDQALARVATLTPAEALQLAEQIDQLPSGEAGVVETIGLIALVLLVLELMGVTNAFTQF